MIRKLTHARMQVYRGRTCEGRYKRYTKRVVARGSSCFKYETLLQKGMYTKSNGTHIVSR